MTREIIRRFGPITSTSANLHDNESPKTIDEVKEQIKEGISLFIDSGECEHSKPSTVIDLTGDNIKVLRVGVISKDRVEEING